MTATLCAATFSNSYVLWHKRCVMLRFVAVPKLGRWPRNSFSGNICFNFQYWFLAVQYSINLYQILVGKHQNHYSGWILIWVPLSQDGFGRSQFLFPDWFGLVSFASQDGFGVCLVWKFYLIKMDLVLAWYELFPLTRMRLVWAWYQLVFLVRMSLVWVGLY